MENKVSLVKMVKSVPTKLELAKSIVNVLLNFNDIKLSDTEITVFAYFMVYGINANTKDLLVRSGVCRPASIKTIMVKLRKLDLIYKDELNGKNYVKKDLAFELTPSVGIYLKLDINK